MLEFRVRNTLADFRKASEISQRLAIDLTARTVDDVAHRSGRGVRLGLPQTEHGSAAQAVDDQAVTAGVGHRPVRSVDSEGGAKRERVLDGEEVPDVFGDEALEVGLRCRRGRRSDRF